MQTSQSKTKKGNRRCELALRETEFIGTIAKLCGYDYPLEKIDGLWKDVLLCQFHDILPGSSINRVYKEAEELYARVLNELSQIRNDMYSSLLKDDGGVTVFNSLSFERSVMVTLPESFKGAKTADGNTLCVQRLGDRLIAEATVPACGSITIYDCDNQRELPADTAAHASVLGEKATLENSFIKAEFDEYGAISSIIDKQTGDELVSKQGRCNDIRMYKDIPVDYEAWDIDTSYEYCPVELNEKASFELVSAGPLKAAIKITRRINESDMVQTVSLTENSRRVDFDTTVEWRELHKMIKVCFDVDYHSEEALHDIQFGYVKRPNHRSRRYDFDRFEVANHKWTALAEQDRGFAVLNDCKYGVNVLGTSINLTLLRAPFSPDPECDRGTQRFVYSFYAYNGSFKDSGIYKEGYDLNVPAEVVSGSFFSLPAVTVSEDNIILESLKPAEDGSGDYILRFYEAMHTKTRADIKLRLSCSSVCSCNMLETDCKETEFTKTEDGVAIPLEFRPFEIKTLRVKP